MANHRITKQKNNSNLPQIPQCLIEEEIFSRLPVKSLVRFKSLSKQWNTVISGAHFTRLHQKHQRLDDSSQKSLLVDTHGSIHMLDWASFDDNRVVLHNFDDSIKTDFEPKSVKFVGSCRGLVCSYHGMDYYFVWNPSTKNSRKISGFNYNYPNSRNVTIIRGFGYVSSIDDYKIVQIAGCKISIFKLKTGGWVDSTQDDINILLGSSWNECRVKPGTAIVNEMLHWLVDIDKTQTYVLVFDLLEETIKPLISLPQILSSYEGFLSVVQQCLCYCNKNQSLIELWIFRGFNWEKHYKFDLGMNFLGGTKFSECNLFGCSWTKSLKIMVRPCDGRTHLVVDPSRYQPKQVSFPQQFYLSFGVSFIESLVSPN